MRLTRVLLVTAMLPMVAGCASWFKRETPVVIHETTYVPASVDPTFFSPTTCPAWPKPADYFINNTDEEGSAYDFAAYEAYRCERSTRLGAGVRQSEIIRDIEARNNEKNKD